MFKIITLILALAAYGAYSLVGSFSSPAPVAAAKAEVPVIVAARAAVSPGLMEQFGISGAAGLAATAAAKVTGIDLQPMPDEGCSASAMSPTQVMDLLDRMPDAQRSAIAKLLDKTSTMWTAQFYRGEAGIGMCLPKQGKLLTLPGGSSLPDWAPSDIVSGVKSLSETVTVSP